jgi:chorismate mutase / prephenate dehydratase
MYQSKELDKIRKRIDELDNNVHDLLLERADLVMQISAEKKKSGIQIVQPAREARMIRRLLARHRAPLPEETIVRIWRELVGSISLLQTGLSVVVYQPRHEHEAERHYWDMARDYFGSVLPMIRNDSVQSMLNHVNAEPWWVNLAEYSSLNIIQKLPYGHKENYKFENFPALVVAKSGFDTSDDDHSLIMVTQADDISQARILESCRKASLEPLSIFARDDSFLIEVKQYIAAHDAVLDKVKLFLNQDQIIVRSVGGFPTPLSYKKI